MTQPNTLFKRSLFGLLFALLMLFLSGYLLSNREDELTPDVTARFGPKEGFTIFLAGDTIITKPWSAINEPSFLQLRDELGAADVAIVNLETPVHEYKGYAQAQSGGIHLAAPPVIAHELAWAGVDMVSNANNHSFDYGSIGVMETLNNVESAGLVIAGVGRDLQLARAPKYFRHPSGTVALIAASNTFHPFNAASHSYPDMRGRPGLNPIAWRKSRLGLHFTITPSTASFIQDRSRAAGFVGNRFGRPEFDVLGFDFRVVDKHSVTFAGQGLYSKRDEDANLAAVREARQNADVVVFSLHAHAQGKALRQLSRRIINAGADAVFIHGPHEVRGIELFHGRPIFYCLGDFVFQIAEVDRYPAETYDRLNLGKETTLQELKEALMTQRDTMGYAKQRAVWESIAAVLEFSGEGIATIRLLPLDLGFGHPVPIRGRPKLADPTLGQYIIEQVAEKSKRFGTSIQYLPELNEGRISLSVTDTNTQ